MRVKDLSYAFGEHTLFKNLNFEFPEGKIHLIQGPSGCGKSSFLKIVAGLLPMQAGQVDWSRPKRPRLAYLHQDCHLIEHWSVAENLALISTDIEAQQELLQTLNVTRPLSTPAWQLSGGERQRVLLVRVLLQNPDVALLDEPTAHLDDEQTLIAVRLLKEKLQGRTVLIVSHDQRLSPHADQILNWKMGSPL